MAVHEWKAIEITAGKGFVALSLLLFFDFDTFSTILQIHFRMYVWFLLVGLSGSPMTMSPCFMAGCR